MSVSELTAEHAVVVDAYPSIAGMLRDRAWRERAAGWAGGLLSLAVLGVVAVQLGSIQIAHVLSMAPAAAGFWIVFALYYCLTPLCEWMIFRAYGVCPSRVWWRCCASRSPTNWFLAIRAKRNSICGRAGAYR